MKDFLKETVQHVGMSILRGASDKLLDSAGKFLENVGGYVKDFVNDFTKKDGKAPNALEAPAENLTAQPQQSQNTMKGGLEELGNLSPSSSPNVPQNSNKQMGM